MMMRYWHVEPDNGWRPGESPKDDIYLFKEVESHGPIWQREAYFDDGHVSKTYGALQPERMILRFSRKMRGSKVPTFVYGFATLTCTERDFQLFEPLIANKYHRFEMAISGVPYVTFRPTVALDLIELSNSVYKLGGVDNRPSQFSWVSLCSAPSPQQNFFQLAAPKALRFDAIVSDELKEVYDANRMTGLTFKQCWPVAEPFSVMHPTF